MKYRKKPVVVEAMQWTGDESAMYVWMGGLPSPLPTTSVSMEWLVWRDGHRVKGPVIKTLEGEMAVSEDDYIICGVQGELYPCKPDIFDATYERVEEE